MSQDFTAIHPTEKRYIVLVRLGVAKPEQCGLCDRYFDWGHDMRLHTFVCPICNRECCIDCTPYENPSFRFPGCRICDECDDLPVEDQLRIAAFTAEMNK